MKKETKETSPEKVRDVDYNKESGKDEFKKDENGTSEDKKIVNEWKIGKEEVLEEKSEDKNKSEDLKNLSKAEREKLIGKEELQLIWFFVIIGVVFASFLIPYFYIEGLKQFEYKGVNWTFEEFGENGIYHGQFLSIAKEDLTYNLYVRNDPRESDTKIDGVEFGHFTVGGHISFSQEVDTLCRGREVSRVQVDLAAFLLSGIGMNEINASTYEEEYSNESKLEYVNCNTFENQTIIKISKGEESLISQDIENPFCYTITVAHCDDIVSVETFMVESIGAFMERDIFATVKNISERNSF
jgi:hypothetical protein